MSTSASQRSPDPARDPYSPHRHTLLRPHEIRELSQLTPSRVVRDVAVLWLQIVACWVAAALWPTWWIVLIAVPVIGTRAYALHVVGHDGIHRRIFGGARNNDLFCDLLLLGPVGAITRINGRNHRLHHRRLSRPADPDRHKYISANKTTRFEVVLFLIGASSLLPVLRSVFLLRLPESPAPQMAGPSGLYTPRDIAIVVGWQLALIAVLTTTIGWWAYPVLWILPIYLFTFCANLARQFLEHAHAEPDDQADGHRLITFASSPIERLFFAPMNMNYHTAHHLWPSIPYYHLPEADRLIRARNRSSELHWMPGYLHALFAYMRATGPALAAPSEEDRKQEDAGQAAGPAPVDPGQPPPPPR